MLRAGMYVSRKKQARDMVLRYVKNQRKTKQFAKFPAEFEENEGALLCVAQVHNQLELCVGFGETNLPTLVVDESARSSLITNLVACGCCRI